MSLANALEQAATALPELADAIRPANGDPERLLSALETAEAARVLEWLLVHEPEAGAELGGAYAEDPAGARALVALRPDTLPKAGRKGLRRALHRLRSRGGEVPEERAAPRVAKLPPVPDALGGAFVSQLDPSGARLAVLLEPNPGGGARLFELVVDEERGVLDCHVYSAGRRRAREFVRELTRRERFSVLEVPREALHALLARIARQAERPPPRSFEEWRSKLTAAPEASRSPGELAREALGDEADEDRLARALEMLRQRRVGPWPPPADQLRAFGERIRAAAEGRVIVSGSARRERIEAALRECVEEAFPDARVQAVVARLRETAFVFWKQGEEEDARACLAAARALQEGEAAGQRVARAFLEGVLAPMLEELESEPDDSLLVKGSPSLITKP